MILNCVKQCFNELIYFICFIYAIILPSIVCCEELDARISLEVEGTGFHRDLIYQIRIDPFVEKCYIAIYLQLPSALYVNVNELIHLRRLGVTTACSVGETDIELFTEKAGIQNVTICSHLTSIESTLKLPIHQRYQYANENNRYINITLPKPKLLLGCKERIKEYRVSKIDLCSPCVEIIPKWREIPYIMVNDKNIENLWTTPVGEASMLRVVTYITLILTTLCTVLLMQTIWNSIPKQHLKRD
ncbi:PREDICTED: LOW QUALITY PROTEIN: uncharacterized protein LOC108546195 [Eufriesea mexicana]|uniref:LOW QUALITY PROTEIN: uncharacterized protein LOC108546195 n=1 Tax=Eufriesea mexicana TaxID=516756 RepID=UPI00083C4B15|nr:PREDICTED: LOW QUALITY PROTEIN: uncharacterized protein LOC108546195 [Eufriesea mexicana]